jgi:hypothetical protein
LLFVHDKQCVIEDNWSQFRQHFTSSFCTNILHKIVTRKILVKLIPGKAMPKQASMFGRVRTYGPAMVMTEKWKNRKLLFYFFTILIYHFDIENKRIGRDFNQSI